MKNQRIYMDHLAGTPVAPEVLEAMLPFLQDHFGNPASIHHHGESPQEALFQSREHLARLIGAESEEIIFTSCGTESNNLAIKGIGLDQLSKGNKGHVIVSEIEHYSVLYAAKSLEKFGFEVTLIPVNSFGRVNPEDVKRAMRPDTILVSIMHGNNEVGTTQDMAAIGRITRDSGVLLHTDAVASTGRMPLDVREMGVDLLSLAGNQFGAPKGVGALYSRKGVQLCPLFHGGGQEDGRRTGTENVAGIVGMGKAAELAMNNMTRSVAHLKKLEAILRERITEHIDEIQFNGHPVEHVPGLVNVSFRYVEGEALLLHMDMRGISVAGASACMSVTAKASHVLEAMGALRGEAVGTLLFSLGVENSEKEVHHAVDTLAEVVAMLRAMSPLYMQGVGR